MKPSLLLANVKASIFAVLVAKPAGSLKLEF